MVQYCWQPATRATTRSCRASLGASQHRDHSAHRNAYSATQRGCKASWAAVQKCNSEVSCVVEGLGFRIQRLASRCLASEGDEALEVERLPGLRAGLGPRLCLAAFVCPH